MFKIRMFQTEKIIIFENLVIWILDLPALLSRFYITSGAMDLDPSGKSKIVSFGPNHLTG